MAKQPQRRPTPLPRPEPQEQQRIPIEGLSQMVPIAALLRDKNAMSELISLLSEVREERDELRAQLASAERRADLFEQRVNELEQHAGAEQQVAMQEPPELVQDDGAA